MRVTAKVPAPIVLAILLILVVALIGGVFEVWPLIGADVVVGAAVIVALTRRWGRRLSGELDAARAASETPPFVDPIWPRWFKIADPKIGGLVLAGTGMALTILLVVGLLVSRP